MDPDIENDADNTPDEGGYVDTLEGFFSDASGFVDTSLDAAADTAKSIAESAAKLDPYTPLDFLKDTQENVQETLTDVEKNIKAGMDKLADLAPDVVSKTGGAVAGALGFNAIAGTAAAGVGAVAIGLGLYAAHRAGLLKIAAKSVGDVIKVAGKVI